MINSELQLSHEFSQINGVKLHLVRCGPSDGTPIVLLHGFPEYWRGWARQLGPLSRAGFHVIAPDQRGYNLSAKPQSVAAYSLDTLVDDVIGLFDAAGYDKAYLVGHDWGGAVAWWTATKHPERVARLAVLNVPHPIVLGHTLRTNWSQRRKSWYMYATAPACQQNRQFDIKQVRPAPIVRSLV